MPNSLKSLADIYTAVMWVFAGILLLLLAIRIINYFRKDDRTSILKVEGQWFPKILKVLFGLAMIMSLVNALIFPYTASAFKSLIPSYLNNLLVVLLVLLSACEIFLTMSLSKSLVEKTFKKVLLTIIVIIFFPLSTIFLISIPEIFTYPPLEECYIIELPVKGNWHAGHAGGSEAVNYHCAYNAQKYAMDIVKVDEKGEFYTGEGKELSDFYTMNQEIYAPVSGKVVAMLDSVDDIDITFSPRDTANPAGNHVVIEFEENRYVFLAHLTKGSVLVKNGDFVNTGDLIGKAGNSGNTSWPHLHMHIQDKPTIDNANATAFPYRFKSMNRKRWFSWVGVENEYLIRNDLFSE